MKKETVTRVEVTGLGEQEAYAAVAAQLGRALFSEIAAFPGHADYNASCEVELEGGVATLELTFHLDRGKKTVERKAH